MKMKFFVCAFAMLLVVTMLFASASKKKAEQAQGSVVVATGLVKVYGSEPNTWLGFVSVEGMEYSLAAEEKMLSDLQASQGFVVEINGTLEPKSKDEVVGFQQLKDGVIHVHSFSVVQAQ